MMKAYVYGLLMLSLIQFMEGGSGDRKEQKDTGIEEYDDREKSIQLFMDFMKKYNKVYDDVNEFEKRLEIFRENLKKAKILQMNERGTATYGVTKFSDMSSKEFENLLGYTQNYLTRDLPEVEIPRGEIPENFDWQKHNAVTPIKNQMECGSCWAFSVVGNIEGQWAIQKNELLSLSEQQLVDCDHENHGCNGGWLIPAIKQIKKMGGLVLESNYPYRGRQGICRLNKTMIRVKISGAKKLPMNEKSIAAWLHKNGPVAGALNATSMRHYIDGIAYPDEKFCPKRPDHAILIVGYGVDETTKNPYWIIKNSWGVEWGEKGYYRLYRGNNSCGIANACATSVL